MPTLVWPHAFSKTNLTQGKPLTRSKEEDRLVYHTATKEEEYGNQPEVQGKDQEMRDGNGYKSCDKSLCSKGGVIAPGQEAVHTDSGETFHVECLPASARAAYTRALAQRTVVESRARRTALAAQLAREEARLADLSRRVAGFASPPAG